MAQRKAVRLFPEKATNSSVVTGFSESLSITRASSSLDGKKDTLGQSSKKKLITVLPEEWQLKAQNKF